MLKNLKIRAAKARYYRKKALYYKGLYLKYKSLEGKNMKFEHSEYASYKKYIQSYHSYVAREKAELAFVHKFLKLLRHYLKLAKLWHGKSILHGKDAKVSSGHWHDHEGKAKTCLARFLKEKKICGVLGGKYKYFHASDLKNHGYWGAHLKKYGYEKGQVGKFGKLQKKEHWYFDKETGTWKKYKGMYGHDVKMEHSTVLKKKAADALVHKYYMMAMGFKNKAKYEHTQMVRFGHMSHHQWSLMKKSWAFYAREKKINLHQKHIAGKHW